MEFTVKITQTLECFVKIYADSQIQAWEIANRMYNKEGHTLPDMDDVGPLQLHVMRDAKERDKLPVFDDAPQPTAEEVREYLIKQGHPHPEEDGTLEEFLNGVEKQGMYNEAVMNDYDLCDVDRWFHLHEILDGAPISFRAAMFIDNALWQEDIECMEMNNAEDLLNTEKGICKSLIQLVVADFNKNEKEAMEKWAVQDICKKDIDLFSEKIMPLIAAQEQKKPLTSIIQAAGTRRGSNSTSENHANEPQTPGR